jgi:acyl-CoA synthetase (AMP-forming)/AMP-acid ligase II
MKFFGWMNEVKPTWYTAVPTMHQAILTRAKHNQEIISQNPLRFIRSSSASMPTKVITDIEQIFKTQLIESYGMTEASHQMCSNLLSPGIRKPGTVGIAQGVEVAIINEEGEPQPPGIEGEIVIKGPSITAGYDNNPQANMESFIHGWFKTGDLGSLDSDGYLTITGRSKEIINRGGEKISPREVDEILLNHPAIQQALTFAMPHEKLGEEVAALVVLHDGYIADEKSIREFSSNYLADFKIPKNIIFMTEIPKGATGKMQRVGLAQRLNLN